MSKTTDRYIPLRDAADYLGLNERTIRRYIARGRLPAYRVDTKTIRVKASDVEALLTPMGPVG